MSGILGALVGSYAPVATAFDSIATVTSTGAPGSTITFSNIPQTYKHLQIRYIAKDTYTGGAVNIIYMSVNSTNSIYSKHNLYGNGTSVTASAAANGSQSYILLDYAMAQGASTANMMAVGIIDIHDYSSTNKNKTLRAITGYDYNSSSPTGVVSLNSSNINTTSAITSILLGSQGDAFTSSSVFCLYGIKGSQPMPATYEPIATTTLGSAAATISFTSITSAYTDLVIVVSNIKSSGSAASFTMQFNSDTASNYSMTRLAGDGSSPTSSRGTSQTQIGLTNGNNLSTTVPGMFIINVFSYAGSTNKTVLSQFSREDPGAGQLNVTVGLYRSTTAISSIQFATNSPNIAADTTVTLYGILKA